jgi:hypothetical protein
MPVAASQSGAARQGMAAAARRSGAARRRMGPTRGEIARAAM